MKKRFSVIAAGCLVLLLFAGCQKTKEPTQEELRASASEEFAANAEERAMLGTWKHPGGITLDFYQNEEGRFMFTLKTGENTGDSNTGAYRMENGRLYMDGWFSENETEYYYDGDQLTIEINGSSFTLTKQVQEHDTH